MGRKTKFSQGETAQPTYDMWGTADLDKFRDRLLCASPLTHATTKQILVDIVVTCMSQIWQIKYKLLHGHNTTADLKVLPTLARQVQSALKMLHVDDVQESDDIF